MEEGENKKKFRITIIPKSIRFSLAWVIFFSIFGIIIQSFEQGIFSINIIGSFFTTTYVDWIYSLGKFTSPTQYASLQEMIFAMLSRWYYFFLTGGIITLIWKIIIAAVYLEFTVKISDNPKVETPTSTPQAPIAQQPQLVQTQASQIQPPKTTMAQQTQTPQPQQATIPQQQQIQAPQTQQTSNP